MQHVVSHHFEEVQNSIGAVISVYAEAQLTGTQLMDLIFDMDAIKPETMNNY